jgi:hypothetical protein
MKQIIIINDDTPEAEHAARFALLIAQKTKADILLANTVAISALEAISAGNNKLTGQSSLQDELIAISDHSDEFKPVIDEMDCSGINEVQLAEFIHTKGISLIVKGEQQVPHLPYAHLNMQTVLNKVCCPLLLIPANAPIKAIEHIVYLADLRYCRRYVVSYLTELARPFQADVAVAHFSAKGLPDIDSQYAEDLFLDNVQQYAHYESFFLNNTKERDMVKAVDVLINGLHNDLLVMVNHRYHFEEILGRYITDALPVNVTVPVMIFPY